MNIDRLVDAIMANIRPTVEKAVEDAYEKGGTDMQKRILQAASLPAHLAATTGAVKPTAPTKDLERAPRGQVGKLIKEVLEKQDGLRGADIERHVLARDDRIAPKSVGNQLRRFKNQKYRQNNRRRWFLIRGNADEETAGDRVTDTPAASTTSNQGGPNGATLVSSG